MSIISLDPAGASVKGRPRFLGSSLRCMFIFISGSALMNTQALASQPTETAIREIEADSCPAILKSDMASFDKVFARDFRNVDPQGVIKDRNEVLADIPNYKATACKIEVDSVRSVQSVAIAIGTMTVYSRQYPSSFRFTDSFVKSDGRWQLLSSHQSAIAPSSPPGGGR